MIAAEVMLNVERVSSVTEQYHWCRENLGYGADVRNEVSDKYPWSTEWQKGRGRVWYFARAEYATMFKLRWA
jgi:hypothetical protein